jgi:hypothetical protein
MTKRLWGTTPVRLMLAASEIRDHAERHTLSYSYDELIQLSSRITRAR